MTYNRYINFKHDLQVLLTGLVVLIFVFLNSCNTKTEADIPDPAFNKVLDTANYVYDKGKFQQAVRYLDSATITFKSLSVIQKFNYYTFDRTYYFHVKKDNDKATKYADSIINLFNTPELKSKYIGYYGRAFFYKGDILFEENKFNEAYASYYKGKLIGSNDVNACALSDYSYRMGMIMYKQEHYLRAAKNFKNASAEVKRVRPELYVFLQKTGTA